MAGALPPTGAMQQSSAPNQTRPVATPVPAQASQQDVFEPGFASAGSSAESAKVPFDLRLMIDPKLLIPDASGHAPIESLVATFVKASEAGPDAPQVLSAEAEKPAPDGRVNVPTVIAVKKDLIDSGAIRAYHSDVVGPGEQIISDSDLKAKLAAARKKALPTGFTPTVATSLPGQLIEEGSSLGSRISTTAGVFSAMRIAGTFGYLPLPLAGGLALGAGLVQTLSGDGWLSQEASIANSKHLLDTTREVDGKTSYAATVGPGGKLLPSFNETSIDRLKGDLDAQSTAIKGSMVGSGLMVAAGATALLGGVAASPFLATASLIVPTLTGLWSCSHQLSDLNADEKDLKARLANKETATSKNQPIYDASGRAVALQQVDVPIADQLAEIQKSKKKIALTMTAEAVFGGTMAAVALGAPALLATAALAVPIGLAAALFPKEAWDIVKGIPEKVEAAASTVGHWVSGKLDGVFGKDGKQTESVDAATPAAPALSPATQSYNQALDQVKKLDPDLASRIQSGIQTLFGPDSDSQTPDQIQAAVKDSNAALGDLRSKDPALFSQLIGAHQAVVVEARAQAVAQLTAAVDQALNGPKAQALLHSPNVQDVIAKNQISDSDARGAMAAILREGLTHDTSEIDDLASRAKAGDAQAQALTELISSISQTNQDMAASASNP
jgi:hypothetical protein